MARFFQRNRTTGQPYHAPQDYQKMPAPGGATAQEQASIYSDFYGSMPVPATQYATTVTALASLTTRPSAQTAMSNASVVQRADRRDGMISTGGLQMRQEDTPQLPERVETSKFQAWLIGPHVNYDQNNKWYIVYPAASVMLGGMHNLGLSQRVDQLPTRTSGGPGPASMRQAPRFKAVQTVPRYSTMPKQYPTASNNA